MVAEVCHSHTATPETLGNAIVPVQLFRATLTLRHPKLRPNYKNLIIWQLCHSHTATPETMQRRGVRN